MKQRLMKKEEWNEIEETQKRKETIMEKVIGDKEIRNVKYQENN